MPAKAKAVKVDIIITPKGEKLAILPLDDYRRLVAESDANDIKTRVARARSGKEETLSLEETKKLLDAKTPLAFWRRKRGLTQAALAERAGISQSYLAGLEAANRKGDPPLIKRLSGALGVRMEDLVED
jgi:ribosome-binding protein aMBF1 (putative translation factor)